MKGRAVQGGWKGPGTVLQQEKRADGTLRGNVWIVQGGRLIKCCPEHLRLASEAEKYAMLLRQRSSELGSLPGFLRVTGELNKGEYEDLTGQRGGPEEEDFRSPMELLDPVEEPAPAGDDEQPEAPGTPEPFAPSSPEPEDIVDQDVKDLCDDPDREGTPVGLSPDGPATTRHDIFTAPTGRRSQQVSPGNPDDDLFWRSFR